jgi:hypothetical protein
MGGGAAMIPTPCEHDPERIHKAQMVYGTPGYTFARYRCRKCKCEWDDPTESPDTRPVVYIDNTPRHDAPHPKSGPVWEEWLRRHPLP